MTIQYQMDVSRAKLLCFLRLLFRWKASLWKNVLGELAVWTVAYFIVTFFYRAPFIMSKSQKTTFENMAHYLNTHLQFIPLTFILGFYVSTIVSRWTLVFQNMGYIENEALLTSNYIQGEDEVSRLQRRAIVRYMCLSQALVFRDISKRVRQRFPTLESLVQAGFMLEHEKEKLIGYKLDYDKYWVPINWAYTIFFDCRRALKITSDVMTNKLCDEMKVFRGNLQMICNYDWVPLPLVYPQVIMLSVYFYFAVCLFSRQFIITDRDAPNKSNIDIYVPIMTMIQFVFYVGWMKAAEVLLNPMGEDDDDFECNFLLDKNLATSLAIADECHADVPPVQPDQFWSLGHVEPIYSKATAKIEINPLIGSAIRARLPSMAVQLTEKLKEEDSKPVDMVVRASRAELGPRPREPSFAATGRRLSRLSSAFKFPRRFTHNSAESRVSPRHSSVGTLTEMPFDPEAPYKQRGESRASYEVIESTRPSLYSLYDSIGSLSSTPNAQREAFPVTHRRPTFDGKIYHKKQTSHSSDRVLRTHPEEDTSQAISSDIQRDDLLKESVDESFTMSV